MKLNHYFSISLFRKLTLETPADAWWTSLLLWIVRLITLSLLLRTYLIPWLLASMSKHVRIRSISLRSIRGLYICKGARTYRVDRVGYVWSRTSGIAVKIDGLNIEIGRDKPKSSVPPPRGRNQSLTLADFAPSPMAYRLRQLAVSSYTLVEPYFRPIIRTCVVACLRLFIRWLPSIIDAFTFDLKSTSLTSHDLPGAQILVEKISLHTSLSFIQLETAIDSVRRDQVAGSSKTRRLSGVTAWRKRLTESFQRSLDRAWGKAQGTAAVTFKLHNIIGSINSPLQSIDTKKADQFLRSPGVIDFEASLRFNPREGTTDAHSLETVLRIGDCSVRMDLVNPLLEKLRISEMAQASPVIDIHSRATPSSPATLSSPILAFPAESTSGSESLFSAHSLIMSPLIESSPPSALLSPDTHIASSPISPASPLLEVLPASIRPRRRHLYQPCSKLRNSKNTSLLLVLRRADITISSITFSVQSARGLGPYDAVIQDVTISSSLCDDSSQNALYRYWMGRSKELDHYESDTYGFNCFIQRFTVERRTKVDNLRLLTLGTIDFNALATQWPSPWLVASPFMCGDPNAPLLAMRVNIGGIEMTESVEYLHQLATHIEPSTKQRSDRPTVQLASYRVPRLVLELQCGTIRGRIICDASSELKSHAIELRTNGFVVSAMSSFGSNIVPKAHRNSVPDSSHLQFRMDYKISVVLEPILVRLRSNAASHSSKLAILRSSDADFLNDPAIVSMELFELFGEGNALAHIIHDTENVASVSSPVLDVHSSTDTLCVELWHPNVTTAVRQILSVIPSKDKKPTLPPHSPPVLDRLPTGLSATVALARLVIFVTAPDINPQDIMELSRGFAFQTGLSMHYSSMRSYHAHRFHSLPHRAQTRHKLYLPQEKIVDAVAAARASTVTHDVSAHIRISLSDVALRSALATRYEADDPLIAERNNHGLDHQEFLRITNIRIDICFSGKRASTTSTSRDSCEVSGIIPYIRATFQLAHVYSMLLALQTVRTMLPASSSSHSAREPHSMVVYRFKGVITTVQVLFALQKQKLVARIDGIDAYASPGGPFGVRLKRTVVWVLLPSGVNRWSEETSERWDELLNLQMLEVSLPLSTSGLSIAVDCDSTRLCIPFGYVLADLIVEASITAKALRHLRRIAAAGCYTSMPAPEAEGPKVMPTITLRFRCLCIEASDDAFESKLGIIWRSGSEAVKTRMDREVAFHAKVAAILEAESDLPPADLSQLDHEYQFGAHHSVSIEEARRRLDEVHALDWTLRLQTLKEERSKLEDAVSRRLRGISAMKGTNAIPNIVRVAPTSQIPPLFRALLNDLLLTAKPPSFPIETLPDFLHKQGRELPRDTQFSLLVPMHINFTLSSLHVTLRDYPLPLLSIPPHEDSSVAAWEFATDLVIAEEMGTDLSVDWIECLILESHQGVHGASPLSISIPKTIMPVKSYANPVINVTTNAATIFSWGVSYTPATQDLMRIAETLSSPPRDSSPSLGFWDKMRLMFHWTLSASFKGEVRFHMKGTRDPYHLTDAGAGFVLSWRGNTNFLIGQKNSDGELFQIASDSMFIAIPNLDYLTARPRGPVHAHQTAETSTPFRKICAKLRSGVRFGIGFILERSCGAECLRCFGTAFQRQCRYFNFRPHYDVILEKKSGVPTIKGPEDSFNGFRSDFIHLSVSLASSIRISTSDVHRDPSSLHLTPKTFAHFWAWCALFDGVLSLPIRQGTYYPPRIISPKLGRHIATLKYRILVPRLFIMHAYIDESRESWVDGVLPWIGVKGMIDELQADMHQRDEEAVVPGLLPDTTKVMRRKPFYAAEVVLKGLDLRALLATFNEPLRQAVQMTAPSQRSNYRTHKDLLATEPSSPWHDTDDFIETDWSPTMNPCLHILPVVTCPHFTYFKRNSAAPGNSTKMSKFGVEDSHTCLLGKEPSVPQVQISLTSARIDELRKAKRNTRSMSDSKNDRSSPEKMIALLEDYITLLQETDIPSDGNAAKATQNYLMPSYTVSPDEWAEFEHVYQIHGPRIYMDSAIRDIMMQYYYCSRARRGFEYHMATRAVKFIRDQAEAALATATEPQGDSEKPRGSGSTAQMAASALRKMLKGDHPKSSVELSKDVNTQPPEVVDPLNGWSDGVSLRKSHCCLLLKPQVVMHGEEHTDACIVAAVQAKLQSFAIMDNSNADDPISGKVMSRNYTSVSGLQTFSPTGPETSGDGCVPLEVLIDLRCESNEFERLVPQTDATFHYDKFNRLRLRNNVTSVVQDSAEKSVVMGDHHLQDQTDLIRVHIPRFTVSASDEHFQAISHIVTKLLLFSDAAHKTRLDKLETLLFTYDFTDLASAANVVSDLQSRLKNAIEAQRTAENSNSRRLQAEEGKVELLKLKAHIFLLSEELNLLFDAIKLAQDRFDDHTDQKSALLLHASSSEISWRMLDDRRDLLSKLVVQDIDFYWLNRQDSSTGNNLAVGNLQAFDGSRHALWAEILSKYDEPINHPLLKRGLFLLSSWTILAPVGGITIYESFELSLHPVRLQIDARVGRRIMEYLWPARRHRQQAIDDLGNTGLDQAIPVPLKSPAASRTSLDSPRTLHGAGGVSKAGSGLLPPLRKLGSSRSFTDLRAMKGSLQLPALHRVQSSEALRQMSTSSDIGDGRTKNGVGADTKAGDAAEMKTRASQKSFVLVRISSLNLLLSIVKEGSFECHDARIRTRDLEYHNQTWSFEELVNQFIPSDMSWRGWVKMAFHQPLLPVLPVARELISKTKWIASSKIAPQIDYKGPPPKLPRAKVLSVDDDSRLALVHSRYTRAKSKSPHRGWRKGPRRKAEATPMNFTTLPLTDEPESIEDEQQPSHPHSRSRMKSLFGRASSRGDLMGPSTALRHSEDRSSDGPDR